ncbi:hypothetical protein V8E54_000646 [Elaphomyces granulatus]
MATEELYLLDGFLMVIDGSDEEAALPEDRIVASGPQVDGLHWLPSGYGLILRSQRSTGKRRIVDRDICCAYVDEKTGTKCDWKTTDSVTKENMTTQQRLEKNILRWVVTSKQPFTVVQDPDFKQIFLSLATVWQLTMNSRNSDPS